MKQPPCHNCTDRYTLCQDACTKEEYMSYKADRKLIASARKATNLLYGYHADAVFKSMKSTHNRKHSIMA